MYRDLLIDDVDFFKKNWEFFFFIFLKITISSIFIIYLISKINKRDLTFRI